MKINDANLKALAELKSSLLRMSAWVKDLVERAVVCFYESHTELAKSVIEEDQRIDSIEVEIEKQCIALLKAGNLPQDTISFIVAVMKINSSLERIGDCAVGIAKRSLHYAKYNPLAIPDEVKESANKAIYMLGQSIRAFIELDAERARRVCSSDYEVDELLRVIVTQLENTIEERPNLVRVALDVFSVARRLERIADLSTNIAEDVIFLAEGKIVRHQANRFRVQGGDL